MTSAHLLLLEFLLFAMAARHLFLVARQRMMMMTTRVMTKTSPPRKVDQARGPNPTKRRTKATTILLKVIMTVVKTMLPKEMMLLKVMMPVVKTMLLKEMVLMVKMVRLLKEAMLLAEMVLVILTTHPMLLPVE
jgi:hypothetical protein